MRDTLCWGLGETTSGGGGDARSKVSNASSTGFPLCGSYGQELYVSSHQSFTLPSRKKDWGKGAQFQGPRFYPLPESGNRHEPHAMR